MRHKLAAWLARNVRRKEEEEEEKKLKCSNLNTEMKFPDLRRREEG